MTVHGFLATLKLVGVVTMCALALLWFGGVYGLTAFRLPARQLVGRVVVTLFGVFMCLLGALLAWRIWTLSYPGNSN